MEWKTNVVLVHGVWADGSSWGKVIPFRLFLAPALCPSHGTLLPSRPRPLR